MIELDGSFEEGGGQIVRTALGLSAITKKSFRITNIRKNRERPGLKQQHIEAIQALKKLCNAEVTGDFLGSTELTFDPGGFKPQKLEIDIKTAGSITLLLQSLIIPMVLAKKKTTLTVKGGTDVNNSIPYDYFKSVFLPHLKKYADIECTIKKRGYFPEGQGIVEISVSPKENNQEINTTEQGNTLGIKGVVNCSMSLQNKNVAERIAQAAENELKLFAPVRIDTVYSDSVSDGCGIVLWSMHANSDDFDFNNPVLIGADVLGERHTSSEDIGRMCALKLIKEIKTNGAVDSHCTDNIIPFLGIFGGKIKATEITKHTLTNIQITEQFLDVKFKIDKETNIIEADKITK